MPIHPLRRGRAGGKYRRPRFGAECSDRVLVFGGARFHSRCMCSADLFFEPVSVWRRRTPVRAIPVSPNQRMENLNVDEISTIRGRFGYARCRERLGDDRRQRLRSQDLRRSGIEEGVWRSSVVRRETCAPAPTVGELHGQPRSPDQPGYARCGRRRWWRWRRRWWRRRTVSPADCADPTGRLNTAPPGGPGGAASSDARRGRPLRRARSLPCLGYVVLSVCPGWTSKILERVKGIEPSYSAWKAAALPLSYTRVGQ